MKKFTKFLPIFYLLVLSGCSSYPDSCRGKVLWINYHAEGEAYKDATECSEWAPAYDREPDWEEVIGKGYIDSVNACLLAGKYEQGSQEWEEKHDEWVDSDSDEPYPEDLKDVDGSGYHDSQDCAENPNYYGAI